jgi:hypothetical protein
MEVWAVAYDQLRSRQQRLFNLRTWRTGIHGRVLHLGLAWEPF